ncbi:LacI family DNA-binding transcriptional regulator [Clostridium butyricum]|uniref:LacI family DNA-binding transcriptional regulator n=1 Tax=Clostridium butyricum TaxID=1492 RepID=UPI002ABDD0F2|nr:LacI family DNA-binding transcriptional regulator [Clostridium butyricum]
MITMVDIARLTGVSQSTVSRVLNGNTSVKSDVRNRVLKCAREHNYQPNIIARSLNGSKTYLIGVIITDISNPFFSDIVKSIEEEASKQGYSIMLFNTEYKLTKEQEYLQILKRYKVDGVLIVPCGNGSKYEQNLSDENIPMVSITRNMKKIDSVFISHYEAGRKVAKHLINIGYGSFIYFGSKDDEKEQGYKDELINNKINLEKNYVFIENDSSLEVKLKEFFKKQEHCEGIGIFAQNDVNALIILQVLKEMNVLIPQDVALVGFDNTFISKITSPSITSIAQPIDEIGRVSVSRLIEIIDSNNSKKECLNCQLDTRLITRQSSIATIRSYIDK